MSCCDLNGSGVPVSRRKDASNGVSWSGGYCAMCGAYQFIQKGEIAVLNLIGGQATKVPDMKAATDFALKSTDPQEVWSFRGPKPKRMGRFN